MRGERPFVMSNLKKSQGLDRIIGFIEEKGGLVPPRCLEHDPESLPRT